MTPNDDVYTITDTDVMDGSLIGLDGRGRRGPSGRGRGRGLGAASQAAGESPIAAASLSLFVLGAGQAYNGQRQLGALLFLMEVLAIAVHWSMARMWSTVLSLASLFELTEWQVVQAIAAADLVLILLVLIGVYQAWNRSASVFGHPGGMGNPLVSGMASFVMPGWGQIVNAQIGKALFFLSAMLAGAYVALLVMFSPFLRLLGEAYKGTAVVQQVSTASIGFLCGVAVLWMIGIYDAVLVAGYSRRSR